MQSIPVSVRRGAVVAGLAFIALILLTSLSGCFSKPNAGEIGVVRNGGPLDNKNIRGTIENGSGLAWTGMFSTVHYYPVDSQQRFFRMATCSGAPCPGADGLAVTVPTSDGVEVTIEGTFYLNTVFNNSADGLKALKAFDTQFATRTFQGSHAYEGTVGWEKFLAAIVEPIVVNNLRETIAGVPCADLIASCSLVQNGGGRVVVRGDTQSNVTKIQKAVQDGLAEDLDETLRQRYFGNVQFRLSRVVLPDQIQAAINEAQSAFAQVSQAQAKVQSAKAEAQANRERQRGYNACPACQRIDLVKALPPGLQALGSDVAIGLKPSESK